MQACIIPTPLRPIGILTRTLTPAVTLPDPPEEAAASSAAAAPGWAPDDYHCALEGLTDEGIAYRKAAAFSLASALVTGLPPVAYPVAGGPPTQPLPF